MKRFTSLMIVCLITIFSFNLSAQLNNKEVVKLPAGLQEISVDKSFWHGNTSTTFVTVVDAGYDYAIRLRAGTINSGAEVTKVRFFSDPQNSTGQNAANGEYTIKIFEGGSFDEASGSSPVGSEGTEVYSQSYTATATGTQEVDLNTPYTVGSGEFWVVIHCHGASVVGLGDEDMNTAYDYLMSTDFEGDEIWMGNVFQGGVVHPFALAIYVDDGGEYQETSDLQALLMSSINPPTLESGPINLSETDNLEIYPCIQNNGPDDAYDAVEVSVTVDGVEVIGQTIPLAEGLPNGFFAPLVEDPTIATAEDMNAGGIAGTFEVCFTVNYQGNDPNPDNNTVCVTVNRQVTNILSAEKETISYYPNPASDILTIENAETQNIEIYNILGEIVYSVENASAYQIINLNEMSSGTYFLRIGSETHKLNIVK